MKENYQKTTIACFTGYIVQAIVNNFVPLLFVTFQKSYNISLSKITALITINFIIQLVIDMLSAGFIDKIGYRASIIIAHIFSAAGLVSLVFLPAILPDAFLGILCVFKYTGFIVANVGKFLPGLLKIPEIVLPIGISFYT